MMDQLIDNLNGLSNSAKNTYGEILRENQPDNFDYQQWLDQCDDPETKLRRAADMLELKLAGLVQFEFESVNIRLSQRRPSHETVEASLHSDESTNESDSKRGKVEMESSSTSPKAAVNNDDDQCPLTMLPPDILAMIIINHIPLVQWPNLELLPPFRPGILDAWRQVRCVNVERDFLIRLQNPFDASSRGKAIAAIKSILQQLVLRSPFLSSLSGIDIPRAEDDGETKSDVADLLAQFEHLESITMGDAGLLRGTPLEALVEFLETTRSRASLKVLNVHRVHNRPHSYGTMEERFQSSLLKGLEIRAPLKLEKFSIELQDWIYRTLDKIDTSRLTSIRLGKETIESDEWIRLLERASKLRRIELKFPLCGDSRCSDNYGFLQRNKELLSALAAHECLSVIKLACSTVRPQAINAGCKCLHFEQELIQMLKTYGARGQLSKFAMHYSFNSSPHNIDMDRVFTTICGHIPSLRSIKMTPESDEAASHIIHLREIEEIDFMHYRLSPNILPSIAKLPHLKRLSLYFGMNGEINDEEMSAMECLVNATSLVDLRIRGTTRIDARVFEKWSNSIAPNLQILMLRGDPGDHGLATLLKKAVKLRILILDMLVTDRMLEAVAKTCTKLEILGITDDEFLYEYDSNGEEISHRESEITGQRVQQIINNCPKLRRLGGNVYDDRLQIPKRLKIEYFEDMASWGHVRDSSYE